MLLPEPVIAGGGDCARITAGLVFGDAGGERLVGWVAAFGRPQLLEGGVAEDAALPRRRGRRCSCRGRGMSWPVFRCARSHAGRACAPGEPPSALPPPRWREPPFLPSAQPSPPETAPCVARSA